MERLSIKIKDQDNVVVAVHDLPAGTTLESGVVTREKIPQAHKIALVDIPAGGEILRYGVVLGYAKNDIPAGSWINEHMLVFGAVLTRRPDHHVHVGERLLLRTKAGHT